MNRGLIGVGVGCVAVFAWAVFAVSELGDTWPYPRVLPDTISFHGATYFRQRGCHAGGWWDQHGGVSGARAARRLGTLASALGIGGLPEYGLHRGAFNGYLLVRVGGCDAEYEANASGY